MLYLFLSASAYTNKLSSLENRVEQLQEELNELKLERGNSVQSVFDKFDADESNSLSKSEFQRMVSSGAVKVNAERVEIKYSPFCMGTCQDCLDDLGSQSTYHGNPCEDCEDSHGDKRPWAAGCHTGYSWKKH